MIFVTSTVNNTHYQKLFVNHTQDVRYSILKMNIDPKISFKKFYYYIHIKEIKKFNDINASHM